MRTKHSLKYLKASWQYFWDKGPYLMLIGVVPSLLTPFLYSPSSILYALCNYKEASTQSFAEIYLQTRNLPYDWLFYLGIIGVVLMVFCVAIMFGAVDRHMRVGQFSISFRRAKTRLNYNFLTALKLIAVMAIVIELGNIINVALFYLWSIFTHTAVGWLVLSTVSMIALSLLTLFVTSTLILWPTYMLHTGMSSTDAYRTALHSISGHTLEVMLSLVCVVLPVQIAMLLSAVLGGGVIARVVLDGIAFLIVIPYYISLMYTIFYDVTGTERMDLNKVDIWSKKV